MSASYNGYADPDRPTPERGVPDRGTLWIVWAASVCTVRYRQFWIGWASGVIGTLLGVWAT